MSERVCLMCMCVLSTPRNSISTMLSCLLPLICPKAKAIEFIKAAPRPIFFKNRKCHTVLPAPKQIYTCKRSALTAELQQRMAEVNWVKCQRLNEVFYTDTKGCRNASETHKRIIHRPSYGHKCTPVCRAFVVCLFVKFVRTICFLKQTRPFSNSQALFGDSSHTKESFWLLRMSQTGQ